MYECFFFFDQTDVLWFSFLYPLRPYTDSVPNTPLRFLIKHLPPEKTRTERTTKRAIAIVIENRKQKITQKTA